MSFDGLVTVISSKRPDRVKPMIEAAGELSLSWVVGTGESAAYVRAGATDVAEGGALVPSRNAALEMAGGAWCVQLSDDLKSLERTTGKTKADCSPITLTTALDAMKQAAIQHRVHLAGIAPTANPYFYNGRPVKLDGFVVGDFMLIDSSCPLRFDEQFRLKEDYDYTLQHLSRYGAVARLDAILASFKHRSNAGGAVAYRNTETEQEMILRLMTKWPGCIRLNPRRENEVLLRWPPKDEVIA